MGSKVHPSNPLILFKVSTIKQRLRPRRTITFSSSSYSQNQQAQELKSELYRVKFRTLGDCKLGISNYPDFDYNAEGGKGTGSGSKVAESNSNDDILVSFDLKTLYIPPLTSSTTKFLGLPLPPFLKISIDPELFRGSINQNSGQIDLEFKAKFWFSVGSVYNAPPLVVETVLTSEESVGKMRSGRGERLDKDGKCRLVGVATVGPIVDFFMNSFLGLPTECLADLNAIISFPDSS
ncbi:ATP-dependent Clp protease ATP-binding subunit [Parasponia andersonii]|uniref:ATP-dependent Clp protease ATP-binding subunit n=1 Tax=Parasponia andersonii TaxID=3476 RepID=A0A2P5D9F0_PARAD|nr:ATP-dependent Clp protease ATP-binding subunit [Parasponia andersonii]